MATFSFEDAQDTGSFSFEDAQTPETFSFAEGLDTPTRTFGGTVKDVGVSAYKGMLGLQNSLVGLADIVVPGNLGGWVSSGVEAVTGLTPKEADKQMSAKYSPAQQLANQAVADAEGFLGKAGAMVQHPSTIGHRLTISAPPMAAGGVLGRGLMWAAGNVPGLLASAAGEGLIAAGSAQEQIRQESPTDDTTPLQTGAAILSGMGTGAVNLASGGLASKVGLGDIDTMLTTGVRDVVGKGGPRAIAGRVAGGAVTEGVEETLQSGQEQIWQNAALGKPLMEGVPEVAGEGLVTGAAMGMGANVAVRPSHLPNENILSAESIDQVVAEFEADSISAEPEVTAQPTGALARAPELYRGMYREAGLRYGVDPNLLAAQGWAESNFNPDAVSPAGAQGIAQFMPGTAAEYGIDPMNPIEAIDGQARYMAKMLERYGGDVSKALAAYNAGPGRVDDGSWQNINETQNYVGRILGELGQESGPMPAEWAAQTEAAQVYNQQRNQPQLDESIQFAPLEEEARPAEAPAVGSVALSIEEGAPLYTAQVSGDQLAVNDPQSDLSSADAPQQAVRNAGGVAFKSREDAELRRELAIDHIATIRAKGQLPRQQLHDIVAAADEYLATGSVSGGVAGEQVFGHPQATNILPAKYGNLIPIKAKDRSAVERRIDAAQALFDEVAQDIGQTRFDASKGDKQAKLALKSAGFREKETVMELLRDETMPSLNRLLKQFPEDAKTRKDADVADAAGFVRESVVDPGQTTPNALPTSNANALPARNNDVNTDIETELSSQLGSGRAKRLVSSGKVQILETQQDAEAAISNLDATPKRSEDGKVQGFTTPDGKVHLVRDGIAKGNAMGVLAHEMGVHAKRLGFKKDAEWQGIVDSIERRKTSNGRSGQAIRAAMDRIPKDTAPEHVQEELVGYLVENHAGDKIPIVDRIVAQIKKWLYQAGIMHADRLTPKELAIFARAAIREEADNIDNKPGSRARSLKAAFDPSYVESDQLLRSTAESLGVTPEQLQREYDAVVKRYQGTVRWLKAPNGKQSNLNERQWVQVRTESFKKWFGDWENDSDNASKVIDDNEEPLVVYHGSPSPEFSEFNLDKSGSNLDPGWLGKGIYFTDTAATADYHSQTGRASRPGVYPVFLNIKNPFEWGKKTKGIRGLVMNGEQLPLDLTEKISEKTGFKFDRDAEPDWDAEKKLSRELTDELSSRGFDGVVASVGGQKEFVAFSPTQIKSATGNTGAFDGGNPDIRYSKASPEATIRDEAAKAVEAAPATQDVKHSRVSPQELEQQQENLDQDLQDVAEQVPKKFDIRAATPWVKTAEYTLSKIAAGRRALEAVSRRQERRFMLQAQILDGETPGMTAAERQVARDNGFIATFKQLKKDAPQSYTNVQRYLLEIDRTGRGFHLSHESGYVVTTPDGKLVGLAKTREEALTKARDHVRDNGLKGKVLIKDYGTDKGFIWTAHKPNKGKIGTFTNEQEAVAAMIKGEQAELRQRGFTEQEAAAVQSFREMTNRAFDQHAEGAREVLRRCEEEGIDPPMVEGIDETRRWAVRGKGGKNIATFESREKAQDMLRQLMGTHPKFANAQIVRQADGEIKKMYSLHDAIAQMGDMRGTYFPRQREHGGMGLRAINEQTGEKIFLKGDLYLANLDPEAKQGVLAQKADALRKLFNSGTPLGLEARKLRRQGFVISFERDTTMPEDVFSAKQLSTNIAALMDEGMQRVDKSSMTPAEVAAYISMHRAVTDQLAGIIKQRGFLSSRMKRSENYWQGFEEDPLKAGTAYANGLAGGVAKRQLAQDLTMIIAGRDITWKQWKEENPKGDWPEYTEFVNNRKIDPVKQKNIYGETMSWAEEVLRNQEAADRIIGTLRGLAVLKYLAFRIPSALVNLSNLAMAVPATISSHTGLSLTRSAAQINSSLKTLADYKRGKASAEDAMVLAEISERGWDNPQFNHDAAAVLRGRWGNAWQDFVDAGMWLFGQVEVINRRATIHAAYKMWQRANPELTHEELMQKAHHASDRAHGWYGRATAPKWTRGAANPLKLAWTFQKFGQNYLLNIDEMLGKGDHKQAAYMLLAPVILGGPKATMITPLLVALAKGLGVGGEDPEEELYAWARDTFGTDAWMRFGVPGLLGISFQGSLAMGIPVVSDVLEKGKRLNSLAELLGAPGSVVYDAYSAGKHALKGEYLKAAEKALPSAFGSVAKAIRESTEGVTTESYGSVYYGADPLKVSGVEAYLRGLSFSTADIAGKRQQQWRERKVKDKYSERRADINREIKRLYLQYDYNPPDMEWAGILVKIDKYNDKVIGLNRPDITPITAKSIRAMLKRNARASKFERMRAMEMYEEAGE